MSFSEDPNSPAAPFSGDSSGQIFDLPDMVANSPTTTERVVDTQAGFLVVIKKLNDTLALSIKRRVGTPPSSSVSLTPDESIKLSRILGSSFLALDPTDWNSIDPSERNDRRAGQERRRDERRRRRAAAASSLFGEDDGLDQDGEITSPDLVVSTQSFSSVHVPTKLRLASVLSTFMVPILGITLSVFAIGIGAGITGVKMAAKRTMKASAVIADPLESKKVDGFVRDFVGKMLDFTANTYRVSQVQAMASMSPELLEKYWQQTKFPLSKRQLAGLPQGANILITALNQDRIDANTVQIDVHAQLSNAANPKISTPVNLRLKLALDANRQIVVTDQQDLSSNSGK